MKTSRTIALVSLTLLATAGGWGCKGAKKASCERILAELAANKTQTDTAIAAGSADKVASAYSGSADRLAKLNIDDVEAKKLTINDTEALREVAKDVKSGRTTEDAKQKLDRDLDAEDTAAEKLRTFCNSVPAK